MARLIFLGVASLAMISVTGCACLPFAEHLGNTTDLEWKPQTLTVRFMGLETARSETSLPDFKLTTWGTVVWQGDIPEGVGPEQLKAAQWVTGEDRDDHHGVLKIITGGQTVTLTVQQKAIADGGQNGIVKGDGTVPIFSAEAQARGVTPALSMISGKANGMQMVFVQGGYEHQFCFSHPWSRWATLYSVAQIAHSIQAKVQ